MWTPNKIFQYPPQEKYFYINPIYRQNQKTRDRGIESKQIYFIA